MAHGHAGAGQNEGGIGGLTPRTGPLTSVSSLGLIAAVVWLIFRHPKIAGTCAIVGGLFALADPGDGTGVQHSPFALLVMLGIGFCLAGPSGRDRKNTHDTPKGDTK